MYDMDLVINDKKMKLPLIIKLMLLILLSFLIFSLNYKMSIYNIYEARVIERDGGYYVQVLVPMGKKTIMDSNRILMNDKKYKYEVLSIEDDYVYDGKNAYMLVNISVDLDKKDKINNNYLKLKQLKEKELLFKLILNEFKKGMNLWKN